MRFNLEGGGLLFGPPVIFETGEHLYESPKLHAAESHFDNSHVKPIWTPEIKI